MGTVIRLAQKIIGGDVEIVAEEAELWKGGDFCALLHLADLVDADSNGICYSLLRFLAGFSQFTQSEGKLFL